jgi:hypothetical protein
LGSCGKTEEKLAEYRHGSFKVDVRTREYGGSGIQNIDICVSEESSNVFPTDKIQCFFQGFDISDLSIKWRSQNEIEVRLSCGRVSDFSNSAIVFSGSAHPVEFHITLVDEYRCY